MGRGSRGDFRTGSTGCDRPVSRECGAHWGALGCGWSWTWAGSRSLHPPSRDTSRPAPSANAIRPETSPSHGYAFGSEHLGHGQHDEAEREHRGRMHHGHRAPDRDGVTGTAAGPTRYAAISVLPWPGPSAWSAPNPNARSRATSMNGPVRPTRPAKAPPVTSGRRGRFGAFGTSGHRSSDAGLEGDGRPVDVQRARQEVLWVRQECVRHAALGDRRVDDRRAVGAAAVTSRQPIRSPKLVSANTSSPSDGSGPANVASSRRMSSPPCPGRTRNDAETTSSGTSAPATVGVRPTARSGAVRAAHPARSAR